MCMGPESSQICTLGTAYATASLQVGSWVRKRSLTMNSYYEWTDELDFSRMQFLNVDYKSFEYSGRLIKFIQVP